jgi:hypothetical protein
MNTYQQFKLRLNPQEELSLLTRIASGLAASGCFILSPEDFDADNPLDNPVAIIRSYGRSSPGPDGTTRITGAMLITDVAEEILSQLRQGVEARVAECPESYHGLAVDETATS